MSEKDKVIYAKDSVLVKTCFQEPLKYVKHQNYGLRKLKNRIALKERRNYNKTY